MEKKLKINFILKGIAVFAFVAFCLLAILAGVTLPFVSNASTADCAVASAENDSATASANIVPSNYDTFTISLDSCNSTDTYYGFYITEEFYNYLSIYPFTVDTNVFFLSYCIFSDDNYPFVLYIGAKFSDTGTLLNRSVGYTADIITADPFYLLSDTRIPYANVQRVVIFNQGFKVQLVQNDVWQFARYLKVFTVPIPYTEKETIIYKTNFGFESRFGFVGSMPSSNLYLNLQEKPILPDSLRTIKDSNGNLVNGWLFRDNSYWLPLINAYDGFGNSVDGGFTGWNVFNLQYNSNGELISQPQLNFWFDNLTFTTDVNVNLVNGVLSAPDFTSISYRYDSNFSNSDNLLVYAALNKSYKYYLQPNVTQNDVYKFFALIDYRNYNPLDNDFYVAGYNSASKGYYDNGYNNGFSEGKKVGYNTGFSAGDSQGYARGLESANNYSFLSLFGAIFDAPIKAIFGGTSTLPAGTTITDSNGNSITLQSTTTVNRAGLLNFNLMGVNLSGFVLALFSISIIVVVIKFALAKK